jgi:MFS family permease
LSSQRTSAGSRPTSPGLIVFALWLLVFSASSQIMIISPILPQIGQELDIADAVLGTLVSAYALMVGVFAIISGPISDRIGRRRILLIGTGVMAVALFYGVLGLFLVYDGPTAVRAAEIGTAAGVTVLVILAAIGVKASQGPFLNGASPFFIFVTIGPGLFLAMAVHRYRIRRYRHRPAVSFHTQPAGRSNT